MWKGTMIALKIGIPIFKCLDHMKRRRGDVLLARSPEDPAVSEEG